jgi:hypothetical protein
LITITFEPRLPPVGGGVVVGVGVAVGVEEGEVEVVGVGVLGVGLPPVGPVSETSSAE